MSKSQIIQRPDRGLRASLLEKGLLKALFYKKSNKIGP